MLDGIVHASPMERIIYDRMNSYDVDHFTMSVHLDAYCFAHQYLFQKSVLDAACGTCFGTMIYSTAAKSIVAIDRDEGAMEYGKRLPFFCPTTFAALDLDTAPLPEADICVSVETIEHLNGDGFFLKNLRVKELIFAVPLDMSGGYHIQAFNEPSDVVKHIEAYGWKVKVAIIQDKTGLAKMPEGLASLLCRSVIGIAERT